MEREGCGEREGEEGWEGKGERKVEGGEWKRERRGNEGKEGRGRREILIISSISSNWENYKKGSDGKIRWYAEREKGKKGKGSILSV